MYIPFYRLMEKIIIMTADLETKKQIFRTTVLNLTHTHIFIFTSKVDQIISLYFHY